MNAKRQLFRLKTTIDVANATLLIRPYTIGDKPEPIGDFAVHVDCNKLHADNRHYAMLHGIKQTIGDTAAQTAGATLKAKFEAMLERARHLESGSPDWTTAHAGEGSLLMRAMIALKPERDTAEWRAKFKLLADAKKRLLEREPEIRAKMDELRGPAEGDASELMAELDAI
jgi:hypothetical protein